MQLRYECGLTGEEYVNQQAWCNASLTRCPLHPQGGCGFARHGTYQRLSPSGTLIARWYCPQGHRTFSLLPDCLAARLPGTLVEVEAVVKRVEQAGSLEAACSTLRLDIYLPGALRWVRRRVQAIHASLSALMGLMPERFSGCEPRLSCFAGHLGVVRPSCRYCGKSPRPSCYNFSRLSDSAPGRCGSANRITDSNTRWGLTRRRHPRSLLITTHLL